jgi:hypothetical protein
MDPSLLSSEAEWKKLSIVICPEEVLVGCHNRLLLCWLEEVVHRRGLEDLIRLLGKKLVRSCRCDSRGTRGGPTGPH